MDVKDNTTLADLLPRGSQQQIADQFGIKKQAVSAALKKCRPGNRIVIEALRIARECGALDAAKGLASLSNAA